MKTLRILGTRGVPAAHGGFETFAEQLALWLVARGWRVVVYNQAEGAAASRAPWQDTWNGVERVHLAGASPTPWGSLVFDWRSIVHAAHAVRHEGGACLTLGYNTALFCAWLRLRGVHNVINMDGIEWSRAKWGRVARAWLWLNDWAGCWLGDGLVADHPEIERHLRTRGRRQGITMIPYGAADVRQAPVEPLARWGLQPGRYLTLIARPEPENSVLEIVQGFAAGAPPELKLLVLGQYQPHHPYHQAVRAAASPQVVFAGAVYDPAVVQALRFHSLAYVHGHRVGGTNPSLVEALGAGNAVLAHDNGFNRWVARDAALYFADAAGFAEALRQLVQQPGLRAQLADRARLRFADGLTWPAVLTRYEALLAPAAERGPGPR